MDMASITTALSAIGLARQAVSAALELRDFNQAAVELSRLNDALLSAQNGLLTQSATLFQLQSEKFALTEELRKLKEALAERARYTLVEVAKGAFAYRSNLASEEGATSGSGAAEPEHYICQPCFDKGSKGVLQRRTNGVSIILRCPLCGSFVSSGESVPPRPRLDFPRRW